jgi:hypothetical protein
VSHVQERGLSRTRHGFRQDTAQCTDRAVLYQSLAAAREGAGLVFRESGAVEASALQLQQLTKLLYVLPR